MILTPPIVHRLDTNTAPQTPIVINKGFRLAARDSQSTYTKNHIEKCQSRCHNELCNKECELSWKFDEEHKEDIKACKNKCKDRDCAEACSYQALDLTQLEYRQSLALAEVSRSCFADGKKELNACYVKEFKLSDSIVTTALDCSYKECLKASEFGHYLKCNLKCQTKFSEAKPIASQSLDNSNWESRFTLRPRPDTTTSQGNACNKIALSTVLLFTTLILSALL